MSEPETRPLFDKESPYIIDRAGRVYRNGKAVEALALHVARERLHREWSRQRHNENARIEAAKDSPLPSYYTLNADGTRNYEAPGPAPTPTDAPELLARDAEGKPHTVCVEFVLLQKQLANRVRELEGHPGNVPAPHAIRHIRHVPVSGIKETGWYWIVEGSTKHLFHGPSFAYAIFCT